MLVYAIRNKVTGMYLRAYTWGPTPSSFYMVLGAAKKKVKRMRYLMTHYGHKVRGSLYEVKPEDIELVSIELDLEGAMPVRIDDASV
jgi:hypothetical protein